MELTVSTLYWILKLNGLITLFIVGSIISGVCTIIFITKNNELDRINRRAAKRVRYPVIIFITMAILSIFTPTTKQMALLIVVPKIVNNEQVQKIPKKLLDIVSDYLDELDKQKNNE